MRLPIFRAGVDASHASESRTSWVSGLYVSYGPEAIASWVDIDCSGGFGNPGCAEYGAPYWITSRNELRLQGFFGVAFNPRPDENYVRPCSESLSEHWTVGLVPKIELSMVETENQDVLLGAKQKYSLV